MIKIQSRREHKIIFQFHNLVGTMIDLLNQWLLKWCLRKLLIYCFRSLWARWQQSIWPGLGRGPLSWLCSSASRAQLHNTTVSFSILTRFIFRSRKQSYILTANWKRIKDFFYDKNNTVFIQVQNGKPNPSIYVKYLGVSEWFI